MAMTFSFRIHPFGYGADPIEFGHFDVHSSGKWHAYNITYKTKDGPVSITGSIPKRLPDGTIRSGHRNFLHLLRDILNDIDLDSIGENYVNVLDEIEEMYPGTKGRVADYV